ncbi:MAG: sodium-dependent transporter [Lachnospiraceae bacterium]|nr:sodium-dependent transporter [Lachnospiraceae bacterium]
MDNQKRGSFAGSLGFVLAAAGSAVGLGNIWRFPYLAARDGGGLFLVIYLILALTFGFSLMITETSVGRMTKKSPLSAYKQLRKGWGWLGVLGCVVPFMIMPYYSAIGGWVLKYFVVYATGHGAEAAQDGFFSGFITSPVEPIVYLILFLGACAVVIFMGVEGGIERSSRILMPILLILVIGIACFSLTVRSTDAAGNVVTGLDGLRILLVPSLKGITLRKFFTIVMDALGQLFYSLSVAMGILIAYGSYVPDDANLAQSVSRIEIFDTLVAFLAGVMIIPAVYVFMGMEGMSTGPSLMFVSLPKVFLAMGPVGNVIGALFFAMVLFAAITSAMSVMEAVVSSFIDEFHMKRSSATILEGILALVIGIIVCLGYNKFYFELPLPNGSIGQVLDILDYISNYILMPVVTIGTCVLFGWVLGTDTITKEVTKNGESFARRPLVNLMVRYIAPVQLGILLLMSLGIL